MIEKTYLMQYNVTFTDYILPYVMLRKMLRSLGNVPVQEITN